MFQFVDCKGQPCHSSRILGETRTAFDRFQRDTYKSRMENKSRRLFNRCSWLVRPNLICIFAALSLTGCPDQSLDDTVVSVDDYCEDIADVFCSVVVPCCSGTQGSMDFADCIETIELECAEIERYSDRYDSRLAARCLDAINSDLYYECRLPEDRAFDEAGCTRVLSGEIAIDVECESDYQCVHSSDGDSVCEEGVCEVADWAREGESCREAHPSCGAGLYCDVEAGECTTDQPALGESQCLQFKEGRVAKLFR